MRGGTGPQSRHAPISIQIQKFPLIGLYRAATSLRECGAGPLLRWRQRRGKEDRARIPERLGRSSLARPPGPLAWVHGASVGEALAVLPFLEQLASQGFTVLLTTGTVTSSRVLAGRLDPAIIHQFVPIDGPRAARRFVAHWRPDLVCFAESELWPNLLRAARRGAAAVVLVNARMSDRSFSRWKRLRAVIGPLLSTFDLILTQTPDDELRYRELGAQAVGVSGNLKFDGPPPPANPLDLQALQTAVARRPLWVAASTHAGEDIVCCSVHARLKRRHPNLLTIIVPRKIDRAEAIRTAAHDHGLGASTRSRGQPIVGKSRSDRGGGQNPIDPAKLGNAVLHGPHVANFRDIYAVLDQRGGALQVDDKDGLADALDALLFDPARVSRMAAGAGGAVATLVGATAQTMLAISPYCDAARARYAA